jgi:glycosyltransferase involved in cell wall biosynthesis
VKIVIQSFNYFPHDLGGSERSARDLARGLTSLGHEIRILLSDGSKPYPPTVDDLPLDILEGLPIGKSPLHGERRFAARMAWNLRSEIDPVLLARAVAYLRRERPDAVLMNNPAGHGSALMAACRMTGVPLLPVIRDYGWFCAYGVMMRHDEKCAALCAPCKGFSTLRRGLLRRMPKVAAISNYVADLSREVLGVENAQVIYNAVPEVFLDTPLPAPRPADAPLTLGYLGRLHPSKGVNELIAAWCAAGLHTAGHRLLLAGDNLGVPLPTDAEALGIHALGRQEAIPFLDQLDVVFLPALWAEPFGRSVIEALARGLFVVGSPNGGIPELIPADRGIIPAQIDTATLTAVLQELAADPARPRRTRLSDPAPALAQFRSARMMKDYEALLEELVKDRYNV